VPLSESIQLVSKPVENITHTSRHVAIRDLKILKIIVCERNRFMRCSKSNWYHIYIILYIFLMEFL
jgi:hypothetical protein